MTDEVLTNPYAQQPASLDGPVPGEGDQVAAQRDLARAPKIMNPLDRAMAQPDPEPAPVAELGPGEIAGDASTMNPLDMAMADYDTVPTEADPGFIQSNLNQFDDAALRTGAGLFKTYKEKTDYLKSQLGDANVKTNKAQDNFKIRKPGQKKFHKIDSESIELFADLFMDESRLTAQGAFAAQGFGEGFVAGEVAGAPATPIVGTILGVTLGGTMAAAKAGASGLAIDLLTETIMDVERDPTRGGTNTDPNTGLSDEHRGEMLKTWEKIKEAGKDGMTIAAVDGITRGAFKLMGTAMKYVKSVRAKAKAQGKMTPPEGAVDAVQDAQDAVTFLDGLQVVDEDGVARSLPKIDGTDSTVAAPFVLGDGNPELKAVARDALKSNEGQAVQRQTQENILEGVDAVLSSELSLAPRALRKAALGDVSAPNAHTLSGRLRTIFRGAKQEEGQQMRRMIRAAEDIPGEKRIFTENVSKELTPILDEFRVQRTMQGLIFPDNFDDIIANKIGQHSSNPAQIRKITGEFKKALQKMNSLERGAVDLPMGKVGGGLPGGRKEVTDLAGYNRFVEGFGDFTGARAREGGPIGAMSARLSRALRQDRIQTIDTVLKPDANKYASFADPLKRYSTAIRAEKNLGKLLQESDVAKETLVKGLFKKDATSVKRMQGLKSVLEEKHPDVWQEVKASFMDELAKKASVKGERSTPGMSNLRKALFGPSGPGKEVLEVMFSNGSGKAAKVSAKKAVANLHKIVSLGERVERNLVKGNGKAVRGAVQEWISTIPALVGSYFGSAGARHPIYPIKTLLTGGLGSNQKAQLAKVLNQEGIEHYLKGVPLKDRAYTAQILDLIMRSPEPVKQAGRVARDVGLKPAGKMLKGTVKPGIRTGTNVGAEHITGER